MNSCNEAARFHALQGRSRCLFRAVVDDLDPAKEERVCLFILGLLEMLYKVVPFVDVLSIFAMNFGGCAVSLFFDDVLPRQPLLL